MAGRGSFIESFPLFGYDLDDYDELFEEKLELLLALRESERVSWTRPAPPGARRAGVYPRPLQEPLPIWVAVGGVARVGRSAPGALGLPMALAIIGGLPERFAPFAELHREAPVEAGHDPPRSRSASTHTASSPRPRRRADVAFAAATSRR